MTEKYENGLLTITLAGRIDSSNADAVGAELDQVLAAHAGEAVRELVVDADALDYISSAGLRLLLKLRKAHADMKIINANSEIYDVLEMTGFTEMLTVEKAYRRLSVDGCEVIGQGANGKVYRLNPEIIIKVYLNPDSLPDIQRERELARKAFILGIPTAIPFDVVRVGEGYGSVFELLNATGLAKLVNREPENLDKYVDLSVELLKKIHGTVVKPEDFPDMRAVALDWTAFLKPYLPEAQYEKLYGLVEAVPVDCHMMHGDYHLKNVMLQKDEVLLIDMDTLCFGNPVFEFASIFLAYCGYCELDHEIAASFLGIPYETCRTIWEKTLRGYFGTEDPAVLASYADRAKLVGYVRMMRRTIRRKGFETDSGRALIDLCTRRIAELLERVESLAF